MKRKTLDENFGRVYVPHGICIFSYFLTVTLGVRSNILISVSPFFCYIDYTFIHCMPLA